ncbi:uncharacterized protein PHALS_10388 [Plasmopara halstedii]|uniref:Uncharacterized protein n=1 Tax=Plasmopara halstedii TaxID=4781 RepID=A0A0P1AHF5_PLAHL|nr:uncharacterized protein PHALS_10388 [Plasmopara halstedii]CEG40176.1 hypothetical protein PHALS_10388 [Plasmopara halstedii]|eukprot:XP_024576545.1 hypothetical protein PHALS_10388 [Plasmopara halstedii]
MGFYLSKPTPTDEALHRIRQYHSVLEDMPLMNIRYRRSTIISASSTDCLLRASFPFQM